MNPLRPTSPSTSSFHNSSVPTNTTTVRTPPQEEIFHSQPLDDPNSNSSCSLAPSSSETPSHKPGERVRGGKEVDLSCTFPCHCNVSLTKITPKSLRKRWVGKVKTKNRSAVEIISDTTFILREQGSHVDLGESTGSLLTFKDSGGEEDEPSKESTASGMSTNMLVGIIIGTLLLMIIGTVGFGVLIYHEKFANKPQTLDDNYANSDSGGIYNFSTTEDFFRRISHIECGGFDIGRDTYSEEMYNLDNDSFLNSLEAMTFPSYSPEMNNRSTFSNDSGV
ncbi:unnamed protein product [Lepeophtheirus salmonis]|uniref:(salmon louse) hypothetical protein n=1 Tax=Lepeophtheirus salmonis TaxID=72036 RepID=A0A7R8H4F7_LEPSM|nr:unnamed protein product [Lepeophtheirus salmonis]CAF2859842.1 unnamed protein product [Lepeophtheirus salmonis]